MSGGVRHLNPALLPRTICFTNDQNRNPYRRLQWPLVSGHWFWKVRGRARFLLQANLRIRPYTDVWSNSQTVNQTAVDSLFT